MEGDGARAAYEWARHQGLNWSGVRRARHGGLAAELPRANLYLSHQERSQGAGAWLSGAAGCRKRAGTAGQLIVHQQLRRLLAKKGLAWQLIMREGGMLSVWEAPPTVHLENSSRFQPLDTALCH